MTILNTIKQDQLAARKAKDAAKATVLTTLIGEAESIGKNDGNRDTTDAEVLGLLRKFVKNIKDTQNVLTESNPQDIRLTDLENEVKVLSAYLPPEATEEQMRQTVISVMNSATKTLSMGAVIAATKTELTNQGLGIDGGLLSKVVKDQLTTH